MKRFIPLILLAFSFPIHAFDIYEQDDVIGYKSHVDAPDEVLPLTYGVYEASIEKDEPQFYQWCEKKGMIAVAALNDRETSKREDVIESIEQMGRASTDRIPYHFTVDVVRVINDVYRFQANGEYRIAATDEVREKLYAKEFQKCIINGF